MHARAGGRASIFVVRATLRCVNRERTTVYQRANDGKGALGCRKPWKRWVITMRDRLLTPERNSNISQDGQARPSQFQRTLQLQHAELHVTLKQAVIAFSVFRYRVVPKLARAWRAEIKALWSIADGS